MSTRECLSIVDAAEVLGVSKATLYKIFASGQLKPIKIGRRTVVPLISIRAFVDRALQSSAFAAAFVPD